MKKKIFRIAGYILLAYVFYFLSINLPALVQYGLSAIFDEMGLPKNFIETNQNMVYVIISLILIVVFGLLYYFIARPKNEPKVALSPLQKVGVVGLGAFGISGISLAWLLFAEFLSSKIPAIKSMISSFNQNMDSMEEGRFIWMFLAICVVGPIFEELVFRGLIFTSLERAFNHGIPAIIISGLAFGLWHGDPIQSIFTAIMGIVLAFVYYKTRNIWLVILIHILNNLITMPFPFLQNPVVSDIVSYACLVLIIPFVIFFHKVLTKRKPIAPAELTAAEAAKPALQVQP